VQKNFVKMKNFFVELQFRPRAMTDQLKDDRLWVFLDTADERVFVGVWKLWVCPNG